jgi:hypothetical protein
MSIFGRLTRSHGSDAGVGIVTVVFVMAVVSALGITAAGVTMNNLSNTSRDRQALAALATSEAGVSQAVSYLRGGNLGSLTCEEPPPGATPGPTCQGTTQSWTSAVNPMQIRLDGSAGSCTNDVDCYKVWIGTLKPYNPSCPERRATPPTACTGIYRIHTTGFSGHGPSARKLAVDVEVSPYPFPIGVFTESFSGNGNAGIHRMSVFSNGCIKNRQRDDAAGSGFQFEWDTANNRPRLDVVHDQPAAAHTTDVISTSNTVCGDGSGGARIHRPGSPACNPQFKYDQSGLGDELTSGDGCHGAYTRSDGSVYPTTSKFGPEELQRYGYRPRGLTDAQYDALRSQAQAQGTHNIPTGSVNATLTNLAAAGIASPVLFWENGSVQLNLATIPAAYKRMTSDATDCGAYSLTIVVSGPGNNLRFTNGNTSPYVSASIFVPDGTLSGQGGSNTIGTVFAKTIDLGGNVEFHMDRCFAANPPGGTLNVEVLNWREDDSKDLT